MYTETRLSSIGNYPCLELNMPLLTWNEWMQDNISVMPAAGDKDSEIVLFSFKSGNVLARCRANQKNVLDLFANECICLAAMALGNNHLTETTIFKREVFDNSGKFFEGIYLQTCGEIERAIPAYEAALKKNPNVYRIHNLLGLCYRLSGNNELAEKHYQTSIKLNPHCPEAMSNLGILYHKSGRIKEAETLFKRALQTDEFYLNALLRLSEIYMNTRNVLDTDYLNINLKLFHLFSSLPSVQKRLREAASFGKMTLEEYSDRLNSNRTFLNSNQIVHSMKSIESFILNGALFGAINGIRFLMNSVKNTYLQNDVEKWCKSRVEKIRSRSDKIKNLDLYNLLSALYAEHPALKQTTEIAGHSPLTKLEFFSLVILEIMRDGQIDPPERKIVAKLKEVLELTDEQYRETINSIRAQVCANPFVEREPKGFQPERLFKNLVRAAARDKVIEESEKKILVFASKAFGISSEDVNRIIAEIFK
ncbi:MAG: hypothetical protein Kow0029_01360 [Candidatus Rifleibacteriota bacterium]